jgi:hypothetical protein
MGVNSGRFTASWASWASLAQDRWTLPPHCAHTKAAVTPPCCLSAGSRSLPETYCGLS